MSKYGVNVPEGVAVSSVAEIQKAIKETFPAHDEVNPTDLLVRNLSG